MKTLKEKIKQKRAEIEILGKQFNQTQQDGQRIMQQLLKAQGALETLEELEKKA